MRRSQTAIITLRVPVSVKRRIRATARKAEVSPHKWAVDTLTRAGSNLRALAALEKLDVIPALTPDNKHRVAQFGRIRIPTGEGACAPRDETKRSRKENSHQPAALQAAETQKGAAVNL